MSDRVLEFGEAKVSQSYWPDREIVSKPLEGEWWWVDNKEEKYWGIFSFYTATKIPFPLEQQIFDNWVEALAPGGTLHIIVPSFEYLCRLALQETMEPWVKGMLLNATNHYSMKQLRILLHRAGLNVLKAKTGAGAVELAEGAMLELEQHYVAGVRRDD